MSKPLKALPCAVAACGIVGHALAAPAARSSRIAIDSTRPRPTVNSRLFGQFAGHPRRGGCAGVWSGAGATIPNTGDFRGEVVATLETLCIPNARWPVGGCADAYHRRNGIAPSLE